MPVRSLPQDAVSALFDLFAVRALLDEMRDRKIDAHVVGGAVRDLMIDPTRTPSDIDLMVSADFERARSVFDRLGAPRVNRHGNLRYELPNGRHLDVIATYQFYGRTSSVRSALRHFDASINALALPVRFGPMLDPLHGVRDLRSGVIRLPRRRWRLTDALEDVHVLLRVMRLAERTGLRIANPDVAAPHRELFDVVDWRELERLNGFGQGEAADRYDRVFFGSRYSRVSAEEATFKAALTA